MEVVTPSPGTILGSPSLAGLLGPQPSTLFPPGCTVAFSCQDTLVPHCFLAVTGCQYFPQETWLSERLLPQELPLAGPGTSRQIGASPRLFVLTSVRQKPGDGFPVLQATKTEKQCRAWGLRGVSHGTICWKPSCQLSCAQVLMVFLGFIPNLHTNIDIVSLRITNQMKP